MLRSVAVRSEDQVVAVGGEHGEAVEALDVRDPFEGRVAVRARLRVRIDHVDVELAGAAAHVGREDDASRIRMKVRSEVRGPVMRDLARLAPVCVRDPQLHVARPHEASSQQLPVGIEGFAFRAARPPHQAVPVGREERASIVARRVRQTRDLAAVRCHRVEFQVPVAVAGEDDAAIIEAHGGFGVVAFPIGQWREASAVGGRAEHVEVVERPDISLGSVGRSGTLAVSVMCGAIEDPRRIRVSEVPARRAPAAGGDHGLLPGREVEQVLLVATSLLARGLEDELAPIGREVRLGVLAAEGQLSQVGQVCFARIALDGPAGVHLEVRGSFIADRGRWRLRLARPGRRGVAAAEQERERERGETRLHGPAPSTSR